MRILIAESDKMLARMIKMMLSRSGYEAECVENGAEAVEFLRCGDYDGAVVDAALTRINGVGVLRQVRERGILTPIMILTAQSSVDDIVFSLDSGANDCLAKPFDSRELVARVRAMTRSHVRPTSCVLTLGNVSLDRRNFDLIAPGGKTTLTNKEFQVLEMLIAAPNTLIRTDAMFTKIWGSENSAEINVIWVNVSSIRKKLTQLNADVRIKTVRNVGYLIESN